MTNGKAEAEGNRPAYHSQPEILQSNQMLPKSVRIGHREQKSSAAALFFAFCRLELRCELSKSREGPFAFHEQPESLTMATHAELADFLHFFRSWVSNPLRVASVVPSGDSLARLMTGEIGPLDGAVIELGPGTGVFTRALLDRGVAESDLILIEFGAEFVPALERRFPKARVLQMDAARLRRSGLVEPGSVGAVVSGLPLLSMSPRKITAILGGAFACLRPGGAFYQFTYGPRCPVPRPILDRLGLKAVRVGSTMRNFPPASVYRITRRKPLEAGRDVAPGAAVEENG